MATRHSKSITLYHPGTIHLPIGVAASGKAKTAQVLGGGAGGARGGADGEAGGGGRWTEARGRHTALANVASNMPVASGKERIRSERRS